MSSCWADEIWGKKLPGNSSRVLFYRGEDTPCYDDDTFRFLKKENNSIFIGAGG